MVWMRDHGRRRAGLIVVGDGTRPEIVERASVGERKQAEHRSEAGESESDPVPEQPEESRHGGKRRQLHRERRAEDASGGDGGSARRHGGETEGEDGQRQRRCVGDHLVAEEVERRRDRQEGGRQEPALSAAESSADEPAAHGAGERHGEQAGPDRGDADTRQVREAAQEVVEARKLGCKDLRAERLPVAERVERRQVDAFVVVRRAVQRAGEEDRLGDEDRREQSRLGVPSVEPAHRSSASSAR